MPDGQTSPRARRASPLSFGPALLAGLVVALLLVAASPPHPGFLAQGRWADSESWSNGVVAVRFGAALPSVIVTPVALAGSYGLYAGFQALEETSSGGQPVAEAALSGSGWTVSNVANDGHLLRSYTASLEVQALAGSGPRGTVHLTANFTAAPPAASAASPGSVVSISLRIIGWPWAASSDRLTLVMPLWPNDPRLEYLGMGAPSGPMNCLDNDSRVAEEFFSWNAVATAYGPNATPLVVSVPTAVAGNASSARLLASFGGAATSASALEYGTRVGVLALPAAPGLPALDYVTLGAALAGLSAGVLIARHRVWSRPPALMYVEEPA